MVAIGPTEELAKIPPLLILVPRFPGMDEAIDGIMYASVVALDYAAVENAMNPDYLTPVEGAARGFAGPVVQILFEPIWGYMIGCAYSMPCIGGPYGRRVRRKRLSRSRDERSGEH